MALSQDVPEVLLPSAFANLTIDYLSLVVVCRIVFRLVLNFRSVCFPVEKA
jgi:hypothetical protein